MKNTGIFTKILAGVGTGLVWFPILAPILIGLLFLARTRLLRVDYLMPAELFPAILAGGGLLIWAALRAHSRLRWVAWGLGIAAGLLIAGQALAVVSGLASGKTQPGGLWWGLVLASLGGYILALLVMGVGGVLLLRDLFKAPRLTGESS